MPFTPEELAAIRAADEEIERDFELTEEERAFGFQLDWEARTSRLSESQQKTAARDRKRYLAKRDKYLRRLKDWCKANPDRVAAANRAYRESHREQLKERDARYYQANRDKRLAQGREYRKAHREEILAKQRAYREAHKEEINARDRKRHAKKRAEKAKQKGE